jgi:hypothetical protein
MQSIRALFAMILLVFSCCGCTTLNIPRPPVETSAGFDVVTTYIGLEMGVARELNPLGFAGTNLAKLYYLYILRPGYSDLQRQKMDRKLSSLFLGAAANNALQLIAAPSLWISVTAGVLVGWNAYHAEVAEPAQ